jgi:hypothetical protein
MRQPSNSMRLACGMQTMRGKTASRQAIELTFLFAIKRTIEREAGVVALQASAHGNF